MSEFPRDLLAHERIEPPKFKKDYEGQLMRILEMPMRSEWGKHDGEFKSIQVPDKFFPNNTVFTLRRRYTTGGGTANLTCSWPCPCCNHIHERDIPESLLAEGKAEFVKQSGVQPDPAVILYLASPYTHPDPQVMQKRWLDASAAAAWLMVQGFIVFSPISMGHPIGVMSGGAIGHDFRAWEAQSFAMLNAATHIVVNRLDGWETSTGIREELHRARHSGKPIWSLDREGDDYRLTTGADGEGEREAA